MGLFTQAADAAGASAVKVATSAAGTAYGISGLPLSSLVSVVTILLTLFYMWGALPRVWRTTVAMKRGLINKDWSLWDALGNQSIPSKDD